MEKEPKPFSEEKAKEIMEAEGLEERSQAEQDAFEAGRHGVLEMFEYELKGKKYIHDMEKLANEIGLSNEVKEILTEGKASRSSHALYLNDSDLTEEQILELIEKIPDIDLLSIRCSLDEKVDEKITGEFLKRFPNGQVFRM